MFSKAKNFSRWSYSCGRNITQYNEALPSSWWYMMRWSEIMESMELNYGPEANLSRSLL